jgi:hypothetical protein
VSHAAILAAAAAAAAAINIYTLIDTHCIHRLAAVNAYMQLTTLARVVVNCAMLVHTHTTSQQVSAEEAKAKKKAAKEAAKQAEDELKLLFNDALVAGKKAPGAAAGKGSNAAEPVAVEVKEKQVPHTFTVNIVNITIYCYCFYQ